MDRFPLLGAAWLALVVVVGAGAAASASADEPAGQAFDLDDFYGLGVGQHRLDGATEVIGWRLSSSWYVGQREQKGAEDGLSLVWQGDRKQVSFSLDGIRIVRRF